MRASLFIFSMLANFYVSSQNIKYDFVVSSDGKGDFKSVQEAFDAVPDFRKTITTILLRKGVYKEKLTLAGSKTNVKLVGEGPEKTIIVYDDFAAKKNRFGEEMGTSASTTFFVFGDDFTAENISFENSAGRVGQAVAVRVDGDRVSFFNCRFIGNQDTLYPHGERSRQYYKNCYIEGTVDFIFGWSTVIFDGCTIYCKEGTGYITAASTLQETHYGFVFLNCTVTGNAGENTYYLGRPWRPFAKTVFINCHLDKHIRKEGWHNWDKPDAEQTSFYAEGFSKGPGANPAGRVNWSHQLSEKDLEDYSIEKIMGDWKINHP